MIVATAKRGAARFNSFHRPHPRALAILGWVLLAAASVSAVAQDTTPRDPQRWEQEIAAFEVADRERPPAPGQIVFVGSSSMRLWDVQRDFPELTIINRGFGGSELSDSIHFMDRIVLRYRPSVVALYAGDNDIQNGKSPEQVADDFRLFARALHQGSPYTRLVYVAIKPSIRRWALVDKMRKANRLIEELTTKDLRLGFANIDAAMIGDDGMPRAELFVDDGLHLSQAGYALWSSIVKPLLRPDARRQAASAFASHALDQDNQSMPYRLLSPRTIEDGARYPLVVFLHGAGERGDDNHLQLVHGMPEFASDEIAGRYPCFVAAPQCPAERKWVDAPWSMPRHDMPARPSPEMRAVMAITKHLLETLSVDPDRVYITGLSMGGFGCWDAISRWPESFAAAAPICGGGDIRQAERLKRLPLWVVHGQRDNVVPVQLSRDMVEALRQAGGEPVYDEYPEAGHDAWSPLYNNPEFYRWLFAQRRSSDTP